MSYQFEDGKPPRGGALSDYSFEDEKPSRLRRYIADPALTLLKGSIGVPEAAVGIANLVSGGQAGKLAEEAGFRPKDAKAFLNTFYSPEQRAANERVEEAKGFFPTVGAALSNPSTIAHTALESLPAMFGGGVVAAEIAGGSMGSRRHPDTGSAVRLRGAEWRPQVRAGGRRRIGV